MQTIDKWLILKHGYWNGLSVTPREVKFLVGVRYNPDHLCQAFRDNFIQSGVYYSYLTVANCELHSLQAVVVTVEVGGPEDQLRLRRRSTMHVHRLRVPLIWLTLNLIAAISWTSLEACNYGPAIVVRQLLLSLCFWVRKVTRT